MWNTPEINLVDFFKSIDLRNIGILLIYFGYAWCRAIRDTLQHHWSTSRYYKWANRNPYDFWGDANKVRLRKYNGYREENGYLPIFEKSNWFTKLILESVWDAWHLLGLIQLLLLSMGPLVLGSPIWTVPASFIVLAGVFHIFYTYVR